MFCKTEDTFSLLPHCLSLSILPFDFSFSLLLSLWSIREPGIQTPQRWLFWGTSLPSSQSADFPNKVVFLASTPHLADSLACHAMSRASLNSVWSGSPALTHVLTHTHIHTPTHSESLHFFIDTIHLIKVISIRKPLPVLFRILLLHQEIVLHG